MKAIIMDGHGPADVLRPAEVEEPRLRENDLLVRVRAAGVNRADILQRQGMFGEEPLADSDLPGLEIAGEVLDVGSDVSEFGADVRIDYRSEDFAERVRSETHGAGVDVVVDFIGGPNFGPNIDSLAEGGRLIQVGLLGGASAEIDLAKILLRRLRILGTVMKSRSQEDKRAMVRRFAERWLGSFDGRTLRPVVDRVFPLEQAADAQRYMESDAGVGKILLSM